MILIYIAALILISIFTLKALAKKIIAREADKNLKKLSSSPVLNQEYHRLRARWRDDAIRVTIPAHIIYTDEKTETTEREITIYFLYPEEGDDMMFRALCHLRNDFRHFKCSRLKQFTDQETGEVITNVKEYLLQKASHAA